MTSSDGVAVFAQPPEGQGSQNALVPGEEYYLIETEAPRFHKRDTAIYKVTVHATEGIYSNLAGEVINAQTCPFNWNQGAEIKIDGETATIVNQAVLLNH